MPCFAARPERGCTKPAYPSGIATARPVGTSARSPGRELDALAGGEVEARVAGVGARRHDRVRPQPSESAARSGDLPVRRSAGRRSRNGAKRGSSRRGSRATTSTPSGVSSRSSIGVPSAYSSESRPPSSYGTSSRTRSQRSSNRRASSAFSSSSPSPVERRDLRRVGEAVREPAAAERVDPVDLVQHELDGQLAGADLVQHVVDRRALAVLLVVGRGRVDDVQHHVGDERLLERRREALDELVRQPADEADGVGDEVAAAVVLEAARRRVERVEELVLDRHLRRRSARSGASTCRRSCSRRARSWASRCGAAPCAASRAASRAP